MALIPLGIPSLELKGHEGLEECDGDADLCVQIPTTTETPASSALADGPGAGHQDPVTRSVKSLLGGRFNLPEVGGKGTGRG